MTNRINKKLDNVLITFKEDEFILLEEEVKGSCKVGDIRKINPTDDIWAEIAFNDISPFEKVDISSYQMNEIRLTYKFDLSQLVSKNINETIFDNRIDVFDSEIRKIDNELMSILDTTKLSIYWGGPDSEPDTKEETEIIYYFDNEIGFMLIQQDYSKKVSKLDNLTVNNIYKNSKELSHLIKKVISKTK